MARLMSPAELGMEPAAPPGPSRLARMASSAADVAAFVATVAAVDGLAGHDWALLAGVPFLLAGSWRLSR